MYRSVALLLSVARQDNQAIGLGVGLDILLCKVSDLLWPRKVVVADLIYLWLYFGCHQLLCPIFTSTAALKFSDISCMRQMQKSKLVAPPGIKG